MKFQKRKGITYFQKGKNPQLLIMSGTHGNEYHILPTVVSVVQEMESILPSFMYIPEASPSAVKQKTRVNGCGHDINRGFGKLVDPEVLALKELISPLSHVLGISFHEDLEFQEFYFYDTHSLGSEQLDKFRKQVKELKVPLRTGFDQPDDPALSYAIKEGYIDFVGAASKNGQFIEDWAMYHGHFTRFLTFEIPYKHEQVALLVKNCIQLALTLL